MRNYVQVFQQSFDEWDATDPMNPIIIGTLNHMEGSLEDAQAFAASLPSSGTFYFTPQTPPVTQYGLISKDALITAYNVANGLIQWVFENESARHRDDWPNNDGLNNVSTTNPAGTNPGNLYTRDPPDFSGAGGLITAVKQLQDLVPELLKTGKAENVRLAGIVLYQVKRILNGETSISEALAFIDPLLHR